MRAAPEGRKHSNKKYIKKIRNKVEKYFRVHSFLFNKYSFNKFKINNKLFLVKQMLKQDDILSITNTSKKDNAKPWYKILFWKVFALEKKHLPLVIVSIGHYTYSKRRTPDSCRNNAVNNMLSKKYGLKIEYLDNNKWSTLKLSNREQKLKSLKIQSFQHSYDENLGDKDFSKCNANHEMQCQAHKSPLGSLSKMEQKNIISQQLPNEKVDIKYNFFNGTNALKAICVPLISATPTSSSGSSAKFSQKYNKRSPFSVPQLTFPKRARSKSNVNILQAGQSFTILLPQQLRMSENRAIKSQLRESIRIKFHERRPALLFFHPNRKTRAPEDGELEEYPSNYLREKIQYDPFK